LLKTFNYFCFFGKIEISRKTKEGEIVGKIISLVNQKGGVGKTTTSINLAASLGVLGKKVLLVDLDPQGNATTGIGINKGDIKKSIYDVLIDNATIEDVIIKTTFQNLYAIPATINLAGIDIELLGRSRVEPGFTKAGQLKKHLDPIKDKYDYIIIDCPPSLGIITTNALTASDSIIIPVQCEFFALEGIMQLLNTIMLAQKNLNPNLDIEGVILTMLDSRTNLGLEVVEDIRSYFKERVYNTIIPRLIRLSEAPSHGKPIIVYDPKSRGTEAYLNLAKEVIQRNGK
jgi:chromosome partitioning protein